MLAQWVSERILTPPVADRLSQFLDLLIEWNARVNLTGLQTREEMEEILIGESLLAARLFPMGGKKVLDVGSGAGIPGLVWAIDEPATRLTSVEVREKKIAFQKEVQRLLNLDVEIIRGSFPFVVSGRRFDVVVTRAVRFTPLFEKQAATVMNPGGFLVRFVGANVAEPGWETRPISKRSSLLVRQI
jgi:16S rRNA (guanine527-N7)-methyltransferase